MFPFSLSSAATTNAKAVSTCPATVYGITASNVGAAAAFLKIYNKAAAPVVGTDVPALTIPIAASGVVAIDFGPRGHYFTGGFSLAITNLAADADTTAVALAQVKVLADWE